MKKVLRYIGLLILGLVGLSFFVVNFSSTESSFQCVGKISSDGNTQPSTVYIKLTEYRQWVGLWNDSHGSLNLEIPNEWVDYFDHVDKVGDQLQIYKTYPQKTLKGNFSKLSKTLTIETPYGFFEGTCLTN